MWLTVEGIEQAYGKDQVLKDLSFRVPAGAIGCLLGPSGCGKTTALRCIAGLRDARFGRDPVAGADARRTGRARCRRSSAASAWYSRITRCSRTSTARGNVEFGLHGLSRPQRTARAGRMLELVGLGTARRLPRRSCRADSSSASRWRARSRRGPRLLLLDEPFSSLDTEVRVPARRRRARCPQAGGRYGAAGHARPAGGLHHG
jgi:iron(III) transport system ATP-binding protein